MGLRLLFFLLLPIRICKLAFLKNDLKYTFSEENGSISVTECSLQKCCSDRWCNLFEEESKTCYYGKPEKIEAPSGKKTVAYLKDRERSTCSTPVALDPTSAMNYFIDPCTCFPLFKDIYNEVQPNGPPRERQSPFGGLEYLFNYSSDKMIFEITKSYGDSVPLDKSCTVVITTTSGDGYFFLPKDSTKVQVETMPYFKFTCSEEYGKFSGGRMFTDLRIRPLEEID